MGNIVYYWKATVAKDKPVPNGTVKEGEEVIIEFRFGDLTQVTRANGQKLWGRIPFDKGELRDFRIEEKEVSLEEYRWCVDSTQHRYSLTREEAESRRERVETRNSHKEQK